MSLCTEFAWGGLAGYKPEWPQPNRSRVLLCARACVRAWVRERARKKKHIPERSIGGWSRSRDFDQQTSFVSTSSPIETTFLVWNFHFSLIPPSFCFYFFSILALWSFFSPSLECLSFFISSLLSLSVPRPIPRFCLSHYFPSLAPSSVPFHPLSLPLLSDFLTGRSSCQAHTGARAPVKSLSSDGFNSAATLDLEFKKKHKPTTEDFHRRPPPSRVLHSLTPLTRWTNIQDKATFFFFFFCSAFDFQLRSYFFLQSTLWPNPSKTGLHFLLSQENIFMLRQISIPSSASCFLHLLEQAVSICPLCCL